MAGFTLSQLSMHRFCIILFIFLLPLMSYGQRKTSLGLNLVPLMVNGMEVKFERQLAPNLALQLGSGFRSQNRKPEDIDKNRLLDPYVQEKNANAFISAGVKLFEPNLSEYPYLGVLLTGMYYNETYLNTDMQQLHSDGLSWGFTFNLGYVFSLGKRLSLDLGMQIGYAPPRTTDHNYYYMGIGFTTLALDVIGYPGGHIQPLATVSYTIIRDPRSRILEKE